MEAKSLLKSASETISERSPKYGPFSKTYERAAVIANATIGTNLSCYDVMMILHAVKLARIGSAVDQVDNYLDGVNYLAFACEEKFGRAQSTRSSGESSDEIIDDGIAEFARNFAPLRYGVERLSGIKESVIKED
jgi:hypothetical protein